MQTSVVFPQLDWFGSTRPSPDCWVLSGLQCIAATAPWLPFRSIQAYRKAAGDPKDGNRDGGTLEEIARGATTLFPDHYKGRLAIQKAKAWDVFTAYAEAHHPLSVAVNSAKLPTRLQFGFKGAHQVTLAVRYSGQWVVANPLQPWPSRWIKVNPAEMKPAVMGYGRMSAGGTSGAWFVAFPTETEMKAIYTSLPDDTPYSEEDLDEATAALRERIADARDVLDGVQ
jgi:hypothetical protein